MIAAYKSAVSTEDERFDVVEEDPYFGPEEVGELWNGEGLVEKQDFDAAKGLIDLRVNHPGI